MVIISFAVISSAYMLEEKSVQKYNNHTVETMEQPVERKSVGRGVVWLSVMDHGSISWQSTSVT